jgi:hypothetical protein
MKTDFSFWDFDENPILEGEFIGRFASVGPFKRGVFVVKRKGGGIVHIWSLVQVNNLLGQIPFGTKIVLKYLGLKPMPDHKDRMFKDFSLDVVSPPENTKTKK